MQIYCMVYTNLFSVFLLLRGIEMLIKYISEINYNHEISELKLFVDIFWISFYFLENVPSI